MEVDHEKKKKRKKAVLDWHSPVDDATDFLPSAVPEYA